MLRTIESIPELAGKRVILRCDLNVPMQDQVITDDGRIRASIPTIKYLTERGARVVICSHLGRPDGTPDPKYSLEPVAQRLEELMGQPVAFATDTVNSQATAVTKLIVEGGIALIENLRFEAGEASKDPLERQKFAERLAELGDLLVSDGFGVVHRKQASVYELAQILPSYAGLLIQKELAVLEKLTDTPDRPYTVVLGGSKVSDKLGVIEHLLPKVDQLLIGGGMVFTVLAAQGFKVGKSLLEAEQIQTVQEFLAQAKNLGVEVLLPADIQVAERFANEAAFEITKASAIESSKFGPNGIGLDIGPQAQQQFSEAIKNSKTVFWNGPMGVFEFENFASGTRSIAEALTKVEGLAVVGGGDSAAAVRTLGFSEDQFGHISTGGGASLEYLEGKKLPGLEVLND